VVVDQGRPGRGSVEYKLEELRIHAICTCEPPITIFVSLSRFTNCIAVKYGHAGSIMYGICIFFIKLSILLQYIEIFVPLKKLITNYIYWPSHIFIWLLFVFYFISTFLEIFSCRPLAKAWNPLLVGTCPVNTLVLNVAASSINSLTDLMIFALPQVAIWRLHTSFRKKISISAMFFIAIL
jgi:hypothetical protein